ncbi:MAG: twin-arginine translocase subunit TatC, partial [Lachnospiraceae bacterium]|nr:twin-arginine translocase subunit TatC [Lachnospiraceae bacterium]
MTQKKPKTKKKEANSEGMMTVSGHLKELRNRIAVILLVFVAGVVALISLAPHLIMFFTEMGARYGYEFVVIAPQEMLMQEFRLAVVGALIAASPVILYEVYAYLRPGLSRSESSTLRVALLLGVFFFSIGILFAYFITLPFMLDFLISLNNDQILLSSIKASISVANYLDFLILMFLIFGVMFEMPLLCVVLARFGLLTPGMMKKMQPYAIITMFVLGAVVTPPDVVSQIMVALPMILLYLLSRLLCRIF